jgi:hypothetical protein
MCILQRPGGRSGPAGSSCRLRITQTLTLTLTHHLTCEWPNVYTAAPGELRSRRLVSCRLRITAATYGKSPPVHVFPPTVVTCRRGSSQARPTAQSKIVSC